VFDSRHASAARLTQSMIATRVEEALGHWDVGDVGAPDLIDPLDQDPAEPEDAAFSTTHPDISEKSPESYGRLAGRAGFEPSYDGSIRSRW
jgi:hypothetical protein